MECFLRILTAISINYYTVFASVCYVCMKQIYPNYRWCVRGRGWPPTCKKGVRLLLVGIISAKFFIYLDCIFCSLWMPTLHELRSKCDFRKTAFKHYLAHFAVRLKKRAVC